MFSNLDIWIAFSIHSGVNKRVTVKLQRMLNISNLVPKVQKQPKKDKKNIKWRKNKKKARHMSRFFFLKNKSIKLPRNSDLQEKHNKLRNKLPMSQNSKMDQPRRPYSCRNAKKEWKQNKMINFETSTFFIIRISK